MNRDKFTFSFGWLALKLLGKSLYSNAWSAISELVANGFDAGARNIYIFFDICDKKNAVIEIFDDGSGMGREDLSSSYVKVGYNKRLKNNKGIEDSYLVMGRKGIGKLAALYLSENYYLITKTTNGKNIQLQMVYNENKKNENEPPYLSICKDKINLSCYDKWSTFKSGTYLQMNNVDLTGLGEIAFESLAKKLSNFFALDSMADRKINLCVREKQSDKIVFKEIKKSIAFKNMAFLLYNHNKFKKIADQLAGHKVLFPMNQEREYKHDIEIQKFEDLESINYKGTIEYKTSSGEYISKKYELRGWIGLHSTIDLKQAKKNDDVFSRNKYYNPIQLRLYIRNKLATDNFLSYLNNTQAFINYIEGEIHFDILDDDDLPDITTSNRQNVDEHDERVKILADIVNKCIDYLIKKRIKLNNLIKNEETSIAKKGKERFTKEFKEELEKYTYLDAKVKDELSLVVSNKIKGDISVKDNYMVFISHARKDKIFTDFIYNLLLKQGVNDNEIFYTSKDEDSSSYNNIDPLAKQIKDNIINKNVLLLYLTSSNYKKSEYCLFEGGAGWATRSVGDYILLSLTYNEIPKFLTNGKLEYLLEENKSVSLNRKNYTNIVDILNKIIQHLNSGRRSEDLIDLFPKAEIPSDIELAESEKKIEEYMDSEIIKHWNFYIGDKIEEYLKNKYLNNAE